MTDEIKARLLAAFPDASRVDFSDEAGRASISVEHGARYETGWRLQTAHCNADMPEMLDKLIAAAR